jgi:stringent starvation protein B
MMKYLIIWLFVVLFILLGVELTVKEYSNQVILTKYYTVQSIYDNNETGFVVIIGDNSGVKTEIQFAYGDSILCNVGDTVIINLTKK